MDTVVLEKPIRWTEMAFGRVDYIIVDLFFVFTHLKNLDHIIVDLFFVFTHLKNKGKRQEVETVKCVHGGVRMSELVNLDHGQSHNEVHHGCVKLQTQIGRTYVEGC